MATIVHGNTVTIYYAPGNAPHGQALQREWEQIIEEARLVLDEADRGKNSRRFNNLQGKFNSFISHYEINDQTVRKIIGNNPDLNYMIAQFLDRSIWNGPRKDDPVSWPPWVRLLARAIVDYSEQVHFVQLEASDPIKNGTAYDYDPAGSISMIHNFTQYDELRYATLANNDDSRLAKYQYNDLSFGEYVYDHLGQRVLKNDLSFGAIGSTIFVYDIFGNLISEYGPDGGLLNDYIYLGGRRLAKIKGTGTGGGGGGGGGSIPWCDYQPPQPGGICGISGLTEAMAMNWVLLVSAPFLIWAGFRYRKNKVVLSCILLAGSGIMVLMITSEAIPQPPTPDPESLYFYHNDHLGTPQMMTDDDGDVVWDAAYEPFGKINEFATQAITNNFRFPGQYEDSMTGMYYNHHRYYMPEVGRYNRVDDLTIAPFLSYSINQWLLKIYRRVNNREIISDIYGYRSNYDSYIKYYIISSSNSYYYTYNNPILIIDPDGQCGLPCIGILAVVIGGAGYATYQFIHHANDFANGPLNNANNINQQLSNNNLSNEQMLYLLDQRNQNIRDGIPELGNLVEDGMDLVGYPYAPPLELLTRPCAH